MNVLAVLCFKPIVPTAYLRIDPVFCSPSTGQGFKSVETLKPPYCWFQIGSHQKPTVIVRSQNPFRLILSLSTSSSFQHNLKSCHPNQPTSSVYISEKRSVVKTVFLISYSYLNIQHNPHTRQVKSALFLVKHHNSYSR